MATCTGGAYVATADGSVRFLSDRNDHKVLQAQTTVTGGDNVPEDGSWRPGYNRPARSLKLSSFRLPARWCTIAGTEAGSDTAKCRA